LIDEFALALAASERFLAHPSGPRFDGKKWTDAIGPAHADAAARETLREVLLEASNRTNDLDDAARLKTAARLDAVLKIVRSFPALTVEARASACAGSGRPRAGHGLRWRRPARRSPCVRSCRSRAL
jgi:hypothetical protein